MSETHSLGSRHVSRGGGGVLLFFFFFSLMFFLETRNGCISLSNMELNGLVTGRDLSFINMAPVGDEDAAHSPKLL